MVPDMRWTGKRGKLNRIGLGVVAGYLLGTFSTADLVAKRAQGGGVDLRTAGTGNPGAANAAKVLGTKAGLTIMGGDIAKGALASGVGGLLAGGAGAHLAGTAAVAGHCYPIWNGFRGGKGVAASVGQCAATFPAYFPIDVAVAAATASVPAFTQRAFAATLASSTCWVVGGIVWWAKGWRNLWGPKPTVMLPLGALLSSAIIAERFVAANKAAAADAVDEAAGSASGPAADSAGASAPFDSGLVST